MLMNCTAVQKKLAFYVEGVLVSQEALDIQAHLATCQKCRLALGTEKIFLSTLRKHLAPTPAPSHLRSKVEALLIARRKTKRIWVWVLPPAVAAAMFTMLVFVCDWPAQSDWAVNTHLAVKNDGHLLDLRSGHPGVIKEWAARQTNLPLRIVPILPADLKIQGSRVIADKGEYIIQVAYSGNQEASSLFAMPRDRISLHGHEVTLNKLTFHIKKVKGHFTVAWSSAKAGYMLVAETEQGINRGCLLCHSDEKVKLPSSAFLIES